MDEWEIVSAGLYARKFFLRICWISIKYVIRGPR
jgi:hypothetical protein